jgi:hypothetical protein
MEDDCCRATRVIASIFQQVDKDALDTSSVEEDFVVGSAPGQRIVERHGPKSVMPHDALHHVRESYILKVGVSGRGIKSRELKEIENRAVKSAHLYAKNTQCLLVAVVELILARLKYVDCGR